MENQRSYLDTIGAKIGVVGSDLSPWYNVTYATLYQLGAGSFINNHYNMSLFTMLSKVYPDYNWLPWKFIRLPLGVISDPEVLNKALGYTMENLKLEHPEDWYRVSWTQLGELGVSQIIRKNGGLFQSLKKYIPSYDWDETKFVGVIHFGNKLLGAYIRQLFPELEIIEDYLISENFSLSFYIPTLSIALDYQSEKDYGLSDFSGRAQVLLLSSPGKVSFCAEKGISILFVPFWWDRTLASLSSSVISLRKDLEEIIMKKVSRETLEASGPIPTETTVNLSGWRKRKGSKSS